MINRNRKKIIYFISILIVFLVVLIMIRIHTKYVFYTTYCKDYYSVIANTWRYYEYDQIIEVNGEPDKTVREKYTEYGDYFIYHEYDDGRLFVFSENENTVGAITLRRIEVTNSEYRFGRKRIGVGTDKNIIEKVYHNSYQGLQQDVYGTYFVEDGNFSIDFYFDENEKVYKIVVGESDIYHGTSGWKKVKKETDMIEICVEGFTMTYTPQSRQLTVDDFKDIELGDSMQDIEEQLGEADGWIGAGILRPVYVLEDGRTVVCYFTYPQVCQDLMELTVYNGHDIDYVLKRYDE